MTTGLMKSSLTTNKLYRKCNSKPKTHPAHIRYAKYRSIYNKLKQIAKTTYYANQLNTFKNMIGKNNNKYSISLQFKHNNAVIKHPDKISNAVCNFFTSIGLNHATAIPQSKKQFTSYLHNCPKHNSNSMFMSPTNASEIWQIIKSLQPKKSTSHDNLSPLVLKLFDEQIAMPLSILISISMSEGIVPDQLKIAKIIPVHKSNAEDDISNYRPISLLPSISKIMGNVVYKRTFHFIQTNKSRKKHSTINAITAFTSDVIKALEN